MRGFLLAVCAGFSLCQAAFAAEAPAKLPPTVEQLKASLVVLAWSVTATLLIAYLVRALVGSLRPSLEIERMGLDLAEHGEEGYVE